MTVSRDPLRAVWQADPEVLAASTPDRWRTDEDRRKLAETDAARIAAEERLNAAYRERMAAEKALDGLKSEDGRSLFWVRIDESQLSPAAAAFVERGRKATAAVEERKKELQEAIRAHRKVEREVQAAATTRRRKAKLEGRL